MLTLDHPLCAYRSSGREKLNDEGRCRMCLRPHRVRKLTRHHLVPQWWFSERIRTTPGVPQHPDFVRLGIGQYDVFRIRDADANIVPLCELCHREVEASVTARRMLRKLLASQEATYAIKLMGERRFDVMYPPNHRSPCLVA